jgi:WD40 repeat protein
MKRYCFLLAFISVISNLNGQDIKPFKILTKHNAGVTALAFSPDGKTLVSGSEDKTMLIWNTSTWESSKPLTGHTNAVNSISFLPSGSRFYSGGDYTVRSWNMKGEELDSHRGPTTFVWSAAIKPDSSQWVAGSFEKNIKLFDYKTGKTSNLPAHSKSALAVAYSPDGKLMASGSLDETILLWNTESYKVIDTLKGHGGNIFCVTFSHNGKYLASASKDNTVRLWEVNSGKLLRTFRGHTDAVFTVAFSTDDNYLASGSVDNNVLIYEICNGEQLATLSGHMLPVNEVAFHPSGKILASASIDKTIAIWNFSHELIVLHYFGNTFTQEKEATGLFQPRAKDESKTAYQERQVKAEEASVQLVEKYYNQYTQTIKGVWK